MTVSSLRLVTPPAVAVVGLAQAKAHARIDHDADDDVVQECTAAATEWMEMFLSRALITQTLSWTFGQTAAPLGGVWGTAILAQALLSPMAGVPNLRQPIELPRSPVQAITGIVVSAADGTTTTLQPADAIADLALEPAQVTLRTLPAGAGQGWGGHVAVTFRAGYGDLAINIPAPIRMGVRWLIAHLYENRGDAGGEMPSAVRNLVWPYRLVSFAG